MAVHRSIKPQILSTVGDVALAVGINFQSYLSVVFQILKEAAQLNITVDKVGSIGDTNTPILYLLFLSPPPICKHTNILSSLSLPPTCTHTE